MTESRDPDDLVFTSARCSSGWPSTATCSRGVLELEQGLPDAL